VTVRGIITRVRITIITGVAVIIDSNRLPGILKMFHDHGASFYFDRPSASKKNKTGLSPFCFFDRHQLEIIAYVYHKFIQTV